MAIDSEERVPLLGDAATCRGTDGRSCDYESNRVCETDHSSHAALPASTPGEKQQNRLWTILITTLISFLLVLLVYASFHRMFIHKNQSSGLVAGTSLQPSFVEVPASGINRASVPSAITASVLSNVAGAGIDGYLAVIDNAAPHFHIVGACDSMRKTSAFAASAGCRYAVNGGPFNSYFSGGCIGPLISNGKVLNGDWNTSYMSFGVTSSNRWVVGHIEEKTVAAKGVVQIVTGFGWLVRDGKPTVQADSSAVAPRTAVGVDGQGRLILLQVDGCEWCPFTSGARGLTLSQLASTLVDKGAMHAIALDGGGSSTTVIDGTVANKPDCIEIGLTCERWVTSALCIQ